MRERQNGKDDGENSGKFREGTRETKEVVCMMRSHGKGTLKVGNQVLVLLPTSCSKLQEQWYGPYHVLKQVGEVNQLRIPSMIAGRGKKYFM